MLLKVHKHTIGLTPKLEDMWKGPYYIKEKVLSDTYRISDSKTHKTLKAPVIAKDLKKYSDPRNYRIPPNISSNAGNDTNDQSVETDSEMRRFVDSGADQSQQSEVCNDKKENSDENSDIDKQSKDLTDGIWYQANRILRQRIHNGHKEYLNEWSDTNSKPTWEADEDVSEELKRLFYVRHTKSGKRRKRPFKFFNKNNKD